MADSITPQQRRNTRARLQRAQERIDDAYAAELIETGRRPFTPAQIAIIDAADKRRRRREQRNAQRREDARLVRESAAREQRRREADAQRSAEVDARSERRRERVEADAAARQHIAALELAIRSTPSERQAAALARWRVAVYFRNAELDVATPTRWLKLAYRWLARLDASGESYEDAAAPVV